MTDNEIIKALRDCMCINCPYLDDLDKFCIEPVLKDVIDLINRKQAEIEKWKAEYKRACAERDAHIFTNNFIKSEAIKEFADRLKEGIPPWLYPYVENVAKEMIGE